MAKASPKRGKNPKDNGRKGKKKISPLIAERVEYVDYKDVNLLRRFMSDRAKIKARRVTGNSTQQQRLVAQAVKNSREMALLPYVSRVTTQRGGGGRRDDRGPRMDGPVPRPSSPPPPPGSAGEEGADSELGDEIVEAEVES